jgi:YegS/Rv2252/BmrU family lipid kinase
MPRNIVIIGNPISGKGRAKTQIPILESELKSLGCSVDVRLTERQGDARRWANDLNGSDVVIGVGGDGTLHEIVNGIDLQNGPALTHFPMGTSNVFTKEFGLSYSPKGCAQIAATGEITKADLGWMGDRRFFLVASIGFDSWLLEHFEAWRTGPIRMADYPILGMKHMFNFRPQKMTLEVDGTVVADDATDINIAIVRAFGGPLIFNQHAEPRDGLFDIFWFTQERFLDLFRLYGFALFHRAHKLPGGQTVRGKHVRVIADPAHPVEVDGECAGTVPAEFRIESQRLKVVLPPQS